VTLRINGRDIYTRSFGTGLWLDDDGRTARQFHVDRGTMEDGSLWINYLRPGFSPVIPRGEMVSRVEALVGDGIAGTTLHWGHLGGSGYVETRGTNSTTMAVDLDLAYSLELADYDLPGDPAVDVDFYLLFSCSNGRLRIQPDWVWVDTPFWWDTVFGPAEFDFRVKRRFENLLDAVTVNLGRLGRCPSINVLSDGTVLFS
jgi:hypothetical protein